MRVVVTGASGMLGNAIYRELLVRKEEVEGWTKTTERAGKFRFHSYDAGTFLPKELDLIVHCAALTDADYCEDHRNEARLVNALWPGDLATAARKVGARMIYVSTDAVYDDTRPGRRTEDEQPRPGSAYAETKLEGEGRVLAAYPDALVVRTTMFGWTLPTAPRPKFAEDILGHLMAQRKLPPKERTKKPLFKDAWFSPLHVGILGDVLLDPADLPVSGFLNVGARHGITKLDFGLEIADRFGLDPYWIEPVSVDDVPLRAKRTKNVRLDVSKVEKYCGQMPTVEQGIEQLWEETRNGVAKRIRGRETYP